MKKYILLIIFFILFLIRAILSSINDNTFTGLTHFFLGLTDNIYIEREIAFWLRTFNMVFFLFILIFYNYKGAKDESWKLNKKFMVFLVILFILSFGWYLFYLLLWLMAKSGNVAPFG